MSEHDFSDLRALFLNCTLKPSSAEPSNTQALMDNSIAIMERERGHRRHDPAHRSRDPAGRRSPT